MKLFSNGLYCFCLFFLMFVTFSTTVNGQSFKLSEHEIKAAYIYNFAKFVEWPKESFADNQTPITICIFGDNPFSEAFQTIGGKTAQGRKIIVESTNSVQNLKKCHMVFIGSSSEEQVSRIVAFAAASNILSISDSVKYSKLGVIMNFYVEKNRVKFSINNDSAKRAKLKINSMLLDVARKFQEEQ